MPVESHIFDREQFGWVDSDAMILCVDLNAPENEYTACKVDHYQVKLF